MKAKARNNMHDIRLDLIQTVSLNRKAPKHLQKMFRPGKRYSITTWQRTNGIGYYVQAETRKVMELELRNLMHLKRLNAICYG